MHVLTFHFSGVSIINIPETFKRRGLRLRRPIPLEVATTEAPTPGVVVKPVLLASYTAGETEDIAIAALCQQICEQYLALRDPQRPDSEATRQAKLTYENYLELT